MAATAEEAKPTAWSPFRYHTFTVLWVAMLLSNIGGWMHDVGAGWLMTNLAPSPLMVSLVQAATSLPVFLLALPAGALADIVDRRRTLVMIQSLMALVALSLGLIVLAGKLTAAGLLAFTFAMGVGTAVVGTVWDAIVPQLVPKPELKRAITLNSVGINVSRAIGPALGGLIIASLGLAWPFLFNAACLVANIAAVLWWRPSVSTRTTLPAERFFAAMQASVRYSKSSPSLRATLARALAFF